MIFDDQHNTNDVIKSRILKGFDKNVMVGDKFEDTKSMSWKMNPDDDGGVYAYKSHIDIRQCLPNIESLGINMHFITDASSLNELPSKILLNAVTKFYILVNEPITKTAINGRGQGRIDIRMVGDCELGRLDVVNLYRVPDAAVSLRIHDAPICIENPHPLKGLCVSAVSTIDITARINNGINEEIFFNDLKNDIILGAKVSSGIEHVYINTGRNIYDLHRYKRIKDFGVIDTGVRIGHWLVKKR